MEIIIRCSKIQTKILKSHVIILFLVLEQEKLRDAELTKMKEMLGKF